MPHSGWHERGEMFKQLSEAERQKVRAAFDKVWNRPEVAAAREKLNSANDEYRQTIQQALKEADPEVPGILEKARASSPNAGMFAMGRMPEPSDPEFVSKAVGRLAAELQGAGRQDHRDGIPGRLHERVMQTPAVHEALKQLQEARLPAERMEAWRHLHETYVMAARQLVGPPPRDAGGGPKPSQGAAPSLPNP